MPTTDEAVVLRPSFRRLYLLSLVGMVPFLVLVLLPSARRAEEGGLGMLGAGAALLLLVIPPAAAGLDMLIFATAVGRSGMSVRLSGLLPTGRVVSWETPLVVRSMVPFAICRLCSPGRAGGFATGIPVVHPRLLSRPDEALAAVERYAPPEHPLRRVYLDGDWPAGSDRRWLILMSVLYAAVLAAALWRFS
jgi:hypothetical protein